MTTARTALIVLGVAVSAQSAAAQGPGTLPPATHGLATVPLYSLPGTAMYVRLDTVGAAEAIAGRGDKAFHALRSVYADLQIPVTLQDSVNGWLGTLRLDRTWTLSRFRLSRLMDCGAEMTGPVADVAKVQLALVTFLRQAGTDSVSVRTALVASARSVGGEQRDQVLCATTGYLESWIRSRLAERIRTN